MISGWVPDVLEVCRSSYSLSAPGAVDLRIAETAARRLSPNLQRSSPGSELVASAPFEIFP